MFSDRTKNFIKALAVFYGTIVGVGLFGLPYIAMKAGFPVMIIYFVLLTAFVVVFHRLLAEVALKTEGTKYIPGYVEEYIGKNAKKFSLVVAVLGIIGALLAYLIVGGDFLRLFFASYLGGNSTVYTLIYFVFGAFLIYKGIKAVAKIDLLILFVLAVISLIVFVKASPFINLANFKTFDLRNFAMPYGVIIFSLWGLSLVPSLEGLTVDRKQMMGVITWGIVLAACFYLIFITAIFGVAGPLTSKDAFSGFLGIVGNGIARAALIFGFLTTFTSFIALGVTLKGILEIDAKISAKLSWFIACFVPLALFLANFRDFIKIIGVVGSLMLGIEGALVIFVYRNFVKIKMKKNPPRYTYLLLLVFLTGIFFEFWYLFR